MRKITLLTMALVFAIAGFAQLKPAKYTRPDAKLVPKDNYKPDGAVVGLQTFNGIVNTKATTVEESMGWSHYDLQTNSSTQPRVYKYDDGSIAGIFTMSHETASYTDRGAGYRFYDGSTWGPEPTARVEGDRAGWPNYAPCGPTGEIIVSHRGAVHPLYVNIRETKGVGAWEEQILPGPADASGLDWPRMVTNGPDNQYIHIIAVTGPTANGGVVWNGLDGAIVYNRSLDAGETWDGWQQLDGMTSDDYLGFGGDTYSWAEPHGNTICFTVGDNWVDQFIMKSTDNGDTWTKTMIWDCPWDLWVGPDTTGRFYCADGCNAVTLDNDGNAHVVFGYMRASGDENGDKFYVPWTDGLIYWNETMPEFPQELDPDYLEANGNLIGWVKDTMVWYADETELAYYYCSMSSQPAIVSDEFGQLFVTYASVTTHRDPGNFLIRHLFGRASVDNGTTWRDSLVDITGELIYNWSECVYASASPTSDDKLYILLQEDSDAGVYLKSTNSGYQGQTAPSQNNYLLFTPSKADIIQWGVGVDEKPQITFDVTRIHPNPANTRSNFTLTLAQSTNVEIGVYSMLGQKVMNLQDGLMQAGKHQISVNANLLNQGIYFVSVNVNGEMQTQKLIVE
jgi:hypothetical protein